MQFHRQILQSVYSPAFYKTLREKPLSFSLKYFLKLALLLSIVGLAILANSGAIPTPTRISAGMDQVVAMYPKNLVISLKAGKASTNVTEPYTLPWPENWPGQETSTDKNDKNSAAALAAADLVICRSGAGTIFELAAFGKPAILIPLPESANDHQRLNAYEFTEAGGGGVIEQANLLPGIFIRQVKQILTDPAVGEKMRSAALAFARPGASEELANLLLQLAAR